MSEIIKTEALVLRTQKWQESSRIVHLFSADEGHLRLIAKGAYRPKSPFRGVLEVLNHIEVVYSHKPGRGLQILTGASLLNAFLRIREDLDKTAVAFAMLELVNTLLREHEPLVYLFEYQVSLLKELNDSGKTATHIFLWHFLLRLSEALGFGWNIEYCLECRKELARPARAAQADLLRGGFYCVECRPGPLAPPAGLAPVLYKWIKTLSEIAPKGISKLPERLSSQDLHIENLLLKHLEYHTETRLDLKSLKWYV